jgi:hypothetical protein
VQRACTPFVCAVDSIFTLVQDLSHDESQRFAALLWSLWKHRNLKLWQGVSETVAQVAHPTTSVVCDLEQQRPFGAFPPSWQRPSRGRFKCNIDAAFSNE